MLPSFISLFFFLITRLNWKRMEIEEQTFRGKRLRIQVCLFD